MVAKALAERYKFEGAEEFQSTVEEEIRTVGALIEELRLRQDKRRDHEP